MNISKSNLLGNAALPRFQDTRFGAPGMLRGPTIPRAPDDDSGSGGAGDDTLEGGGGNDVIDPQAHAALAAAHERLKKDAKADRDRLKAIETEMAKAKKEKEDAEHEAAHKSGDVEKVKTQLEAKHSAELKAANDRADKAEAQVRKLVIENGLSTQLDAVRIKPDLKKAAAAMLRDGIELEDDSDGNPTAMKDSLPLAQAIKLWAESEEGKAFILDGNSGGGAGGGGKHSGRNPWTKETWNVTEQDAVEAKNPGLATRLKAEAGVQD